MNVRRTSALTDNVCPRVRFTGVKVDFKKEFGLAFGDYVEAYNPRAEKRSNDIMMERTEPCIALYPSANKNGSWIMYNLATKSYVRQTQWRKMIITDVVVSKMNEAAGATGVVAADITDQENNENNDVVENNMPEMHVPATKAEPAGYTNEEADIEDDMPELVDQEDDESADEAGDASKEVDDEMPSLNDPGNYDSDNDEEETEHGDAGDDIKGVERLKRSTAGKKNLDEDYVWNFLNYSVKHGLRTFRGMAEGACRAELKQLFLEKKALVPVEWSSLNKYKGVW
jgi:hypothetical protein